MRFQFRLLVVLLLVLGAWVTPLAVPHHASGVVLADNDKSDDKSDDKGKDKEKKDKSGKSPVNPSAGYTVDVTCDGSDATTTCQFTPREPDGGKKVSHLLIPDEAVCADVVDSDTDYVDPDPNIHRTGFRATGQKGASLTLAGEVTTSGVTTYWVKAASGVFPATGPALACTADAAVSTPEATTPPTEGGPAPTEAVATEAPPPATPPATTGTILVTTYTCSGVTPSPDVDWYGTCQPATAGHTFAVTGGSTELSQATGEDGTATFTDLAPTSYSLDDTSADWCHAESDSVNSSGQLTIEAGATAKVWLFYCS